MFTDVGFHLKSGFKKLLCSQMLVFTLILVSRKYCVHQFFLYTPPPEGVPEGTPEGGGVNLTVYPESSTNTDIISF